MTKSGACLMVAALVGACSSDHGPLQTGALGIRVAPSEVLLDPGQDAPLEGVVADREGHRLSEPEISWIARDTSVARVSSRGLVHGVGAGTTFIVAVHGALRDSSLVLVAGGGPTGELAHPNEPSGNEPFASASMQERFAWPEAVITGHGMGKWWEWRGDRMNTAIVLDDDAPGGPHLNRTRFRELHPPGIGPVNWGGWADAEEGASAEYRQIYFSKRFRLVDSGSGDWESQRVGTKLGFFGVARCRGSRAEIYPLLQGGLRSEFTLRVVQQGPVSRSMRQNLFTHPVVRVGEWHHWELEMVINDVGTANGELRWWIDGQLIMEYRNVVYRTSEHPCGFGAYKWNPTWGGIGGPPKARDDFIDISHIRISGQPLR